MAEDQPTDVLFRASKRRKVLRKPAHQEDEDEAPPALTEPSAITKHDKEDDQNGVGGVARVQRKAGTRKLGIGFSSGDSTRKNEHEQDEELALVPVSEDGVAEIPKIDRFVKPTGRVGVTEDRHMMAYVDSKLAEARPSTDVQSKGASSDLDTGSSRVEHGGEGGGSLNSPSTTMRSHAPPGERTYQIAQERSTRVYQRPTKRRPPPAREQTDVARDSMIDLIMGENQVPHYDRSLPQTQGGEEDEVAEEEAFKAQLLADLERNKRRPPLQKSSASTSTGPKLGGSRSAREKMRAMEEAKASTGKK